MKTPIPLSVKNVCIKMNHERSLTDINLQVNPGEFVSLMGENGVGKTTLLEAILGYRKIHSGEVHFWGKFLKDTDSNWLFARTAFVSSQSEIYPNGATISDLMNSLGIMYPHWNQDLVNLLLESFKLQKSQSLNDLSSGESTKIKLIKALAFEPKLLILDELTANLSPESKNATTSVLIDLFSRNNMAVLYVCHSQAEAISLSDRVLILEANGLNERLN